VVLLSFFVFPDARPRLALAAWLIGTASSLAFVNYPNLFGGVFPEAHFPNQPLIDLLHGADLSGLVGLVVAAGLYAALRRARA
jgi:hypothetical protein